MDKHIKSGFGFDNYYVDHIEFKINRECIIEGDPVDIEIEAKFGVGFSFNQEEKRAQITLDCIIFDEFITNNYPFFIRVRLVGEFFLEGDSTDQDLINYCEVNGTAVLFPYLRSTVATLTAIAGVPSLNLPLINIHKLIEAQKKEKTQGEEN